MLDIVGIENQQCFQHKPHIGWAFLDLRLAKGLQQPAPQVVHRLATLLPLHAEWPAEPVDPLFDMDNHDTQLGGDANSKGIVKPLNAVAEVVKLLPPQGVKGPGREHYTTRP